MADPWLLIQDPLAAASGSSAAHQLITRPRWKICRRVLLAAAPIGAVSPGAGNPVFSRHFSGLQEITCRRSTLPVLQACVPLLPCWQRIRIQCSASADHPTPASGSAGESCRQLLRSARMISPAKCLRATLRPVH